MAPIKFEEGIKDKIEGRQLQPSPDAWQKLSDRLDAEPNKNKRKTFWWLGMAASIVGVILVASIILSDNSVEIIDPQILVDEEATKAIDVDEVKEDAPIETPLQEQPSLVLEAPFVDDNQNEIQATPSISNHVAESSIKNTLLEKERSLRLDSTETIAYQESTNVNNVAAIKSPEDLKVDEVVAKILKLQEEKSRVSDAEIDALLLGAQRELMSQSFYDASSKTVDAELLLLEVELDLDQSFRNRVFEALKSGYAKVRTAVADRNQ